MRLALSNSVCRAARRDAEKQRLVQGVGWKGYSLQRGFYVGSMPGVSRLGVGDIRMQDAGQARRPHASMQGPTRFASHSAKGGESTLPAPGAPVPRASATTRTSGRRRR